MERVSAVTMKGNGLTLLGNELHIGDKAPDVEVVANDMSKVRISDFKGKVLVLSSVPSLDTPVCHKETRRFNELASEFGEDVAILTISMDLPFAQKRWCAAEGIPNCKTFSDHKNAEFGMAYGTLIKELRLLARQIFVVDKDGIIRYIQAVNEISNEPDYNAVLDAVAQIKGVFAK